MKMSSSTPLKSIISGFIKRSERGFEVAEIHKRLDNSDGHEYEIFDDIHGELESEFRLSESETEYHFVVCAKAWYMTDLSTGEVDFEYDFFEAQSASEIEEFLKEDQ